MTPPEPQDPAFEALDEDAELKLLVCKEDEVGVVAK